MSINPPPDHILPIFNQDDFQEYLQNLDLATADGRYAKLTGSIFSGLITANGGISTTSLSFNTAKVAAGTAAAPSYSFTGDTNTGIFSDVADTVKFTTGGTERASISTSALTSTLPIVHPAGTAAAPSITFTSDTNTGIFSDAADTVKFTTGGTERASISTTAITSTLPMRMPVSNNITPSYSFTGHTNTGIFYDDLYFNAICLSVNGTGKFFIGETFLYTTIPFFSVTGTAAVPAYTFAFDGDTGLFIDNHDLAFSVAGVKRLSISTSALTSTLPIINTAGTAAAPSYSFTGDANTGIFSDVADTVKFTTGGTERASISTTAITSTLPISIADGTAAAPSLNFTNDPDTGLYLYADGVIGFAVGGAVKLTISANYLTTQSPIGLSAGTAAAPSLGFTGDSNTGIFSGTADTIKFSTGGTERASISTTALTSTVPIVYPAGTAATPSITFTSDTNTGIFSDAADTVKFTTGGTERASISTTALTSTLPIYNADGAIATPSITFTADTNTGFYRPAADAIGVSCGGSYVGGFSSTVFESLKTIQLTPTGNAIIINPTGNNNLIISTGASSVTLTAPDIYKVSTGTNLGYYSKSSVSLHRFYRDTSTTSNSVLEVGSDVGSSDATVLQILANGDVKNVNGVYGTISDQRLKKEIRDARDDYIDDVMKLKLKKYKMKNGSDASFGLVNPKQETEDAELLGLLAQDLLNDDVFPGLVSEDAQHTQIDEDGNEYNPLGIKSSILIYPLISCVQHLKKEIELLKDELQKTY